MPIVAGMNARPDRETLGELLASRRRRRFVGRSAEVELFSAALAADDPTFRVLHIHGPGGIGKTSLLEVYARRAEGTGAAVVRLDGRELTPEPPAVLEALRPVLDIAAAGPATTTAGRVVLVVDAYDRLAPVDEWVRTDLLPRLPATVLTVLAARRPPDPAWRVDPAWRDLLRVVSLRNLGPDESRQLLRRTDVDEALHDRLLAATHGHPLALSLLADVVAGGGAAPGTDEPLPPDVVASLVRRFIEVVPTARHRRALEVCAIARVTTETLLRDVLDVDDAHDLFAWLRELSFVESGPDGVCPHDLARDVLDVDLRWRDPDGYEQVFRRVRAHIHGRLRALHGRAQQRALFDEKFVFRNLPSVLSPIDWDAWGRHPPEPAAPGDRDAVLALVAAHEGDAAAAIAEHWLDRQPGGCFVLREEGVVRGVLMLLDLTAATPHDRAVDPGAEAAWAYVQRNAPPRTGEVVTQTRFVVDRDAYQGPSPTLNATPILTIQRYLATPHLSWDLLTLHEPEPWDDYFAIADLHRAEGGDFTVGGRRYGLFAHDFRQVPVDAWLELVTERALAQDPTVPPPPTPQAFVLSHEEFTDAVRQALGDLRRPDLLARNPLLRTALLRDRARDDQPTADDLARLIDEAINSLRAHPRDDKLLRAVERTYVHPAATQERAAAALDLPFSTFRRHLTQGVSRVVDWLWDREVYGGHDRGEQR